MSGKHDQLCLSREVLPSDLARFCDCERVGRIRADERKRIEDAVLKLPAPIRWGGGDVDDLLLFLSEVLRVVRDEEVIDDE